MFVIFIQLHVTLLSRRELLVPLRWFCGHTLLAEEVRGLEHLLPKGGEAIGPGLFSTHTAHFLIVFVLDTMSLIQAKTEPDIHTEMICVLTLVPKVIYMCIYIIINTSGSSLGGGFPRVVVSHTRWL